jgi:hypothetical protein
MRAQFVNEEQKQGSLYRSTDQVWLIMLLELEGKSLKVKEDGKFISLSRDTESGGQDDFGGREIVIEFDEQKIFQQKAEDIEYDAFYFDQHPDICLYVTGYKGEKDYYEQKDFSGPDEANENMELTWDQYVEDFEHEEEIVLKELKYVQRLIKYVDILKEANPVLIEALEEFNIPYKAHKGIKELKKQTYFWEN